MVVDGYSMDACAGSSLISLPRPGAAVGGHVLAHASTVRLSVRKGKAEQRLMKVGTAGCWCLPVFPLCHSCCTSTTPTASCRPRCPPRLQVVDAPNLPEAEASYCIAADGINDYKD